MTAHTRWQRWSWPLALTALALLAVGLRLYAIDRQSLWADEGISRTYALRSVDVIIGEALRGLHPPFYYLVLHGWSRLVGTGVAELRALSALAGAVGVVVTTVLARRWAGPGAALVTALAALTAPLAIHYGQEARMYSLVMTLASVLWLWYDEWSRHGRRRALIGYGISATALIFSHAFTPTVIVVPAVLGALQLWRSRRWPLLAGWGIGHLILAAISLAWMLLNRERLAAWPAGATAPWYTMPFDMLASFSLGRDPPSALYVWLVPFGVLLVASLGRLDGRMPPWAPLLWCGVPLLALMLLSLEQPYYRPRFLLLALPAFHLLLGRGAAVLQAALARRTRHVMPIAAALLAVAAIGPLQREWFDPAAWRDDFRGVSAAIERSARDDDIIIANGHAQFDALQAYLERPLRREVVPRVRPLDRVAVEHQLGALGDQPRRVYAVYYVLHEADPEQVIPAWLTANSFIGGSRWYGGVQLAIYELAHLDGPARPVDITFADAIALTHVRVGPDAVLPGDAVLIELDWQLQDAATPLDVFVHLVDAAGRIVAQYDGPLASADAAQHVTQRIALVTTRDDAPGWHRILVGVVRAADGTRLTASVAGDALEVAEVALIAPQAAAP